MKSAGITFRYAHKLEPYAAALRAAGIEPAPLAASEQRQVLNGLHGLVLSGGTDVDPALYGEEREARTHAPDAERDEFERQLLLQALAADIPVLAICRGMQLFNVCHPGGTLVQHCEGHSIREPDPSSPAHDIDVASSSLLFQIVGRERLPVNSRHHQAVARVGAGLTPVAWSEGDRIVEAVERQDRRFALAVQWHPEDQIAQFPEQLRLFEAFATVL